MKSNGLILLAAGLRLAVCWSVGDCLHDTALAYTATAPALGSFVVTNSHDTNFLLKFGSGFYFSQGPNVRLYTNYLGQVDSDYSSSRFGTNHNLSVNRGTPYGYYLAHAVIPVSPLTTFTAYLHSSESIYTNLISDTVQFDTGSYLKGWHFYTYSNGWSFISEFVNYGSSGWIYNPYGGIWLLLPEYSNAFNYDTWYNQTNELLYKSLITGFDPYYHVSGNIVHPFPYPVTFTVGLGSNVDLSRAIHFRIVTDLMAGYWSTNPPFGRVFNGTNQFSSTNDWYAEPLDVTLQSVDYCGTTPIFYNAPYTISNPSADFAEESNLPAYTPLITGFVAGKVTSSVTGVGGPPSATFQVLTIGTLGSGWNTNYAGTSGTNGTFTSSFSTPNYSFWQTNVIPAGTYVTNYTYSSFMDPINGIPPIGTNIVYYAVNTTNIIQPSYGTFFRVKFP